MDEAYAQQDTAIANIVIWGSLVAASDPQEKFNSISVNANNIVRPEARNLADVRSFSIKLP